jgi:hypothetical protein
MNYFTILLLVLGAQGALAQSGHFARYERLKDPDSLSLQIHTVVLKAGTSTVSADSCVLSYDPVNQFPYYRLTQLGSDPLDSVQVVLRAELPVACHLLVYWLDPENTTHFLSSIAAGTPANIQESTWKVPLYAGSLSYLVVLLSNHPVSSPEDLLSNLELTQGSFLFRQRQLFGKGQLPALPTWRLFQEGPPGVQWESFLFKEKQFTYLPVLFCLQRDGASKKM